MAHRLHASAPPGLNIIGSPLNAKNALHPMFQARKSQSAEMLELRYSDKDANKPKCRTCMPPGMLKTTVKQSELSDTTDFHSVIV